MIINIRGTSGSGKTTLVRSLLEAYGPVVEHKFTTGAVATCVAVPGLHPVWAIGSYRNVCGGCDTIDDQNVVCSAVRYYSQFGNVIFEGLILSHLWARYRELTREMTARGLRYVWAFLDTPLDVCLKNIQSRRAARGNNKPLNPANTEQKYHDILRCRGRVWRAGFEYVDLAYGPMLLDQLFELLRSGQSSFLSYEQCFREDHFKPTDANG